jgi:hypothetical protein
MLDMGVKIGYYGYVRSDVVQFFLRLLLIAAVCVFVWRLVEPKNRAMRILRAALLVLALLTVLAAIKIATP